MKWIGLIGRILSHNRLHSPSLSPLGKERCRISLIIFITTTTCPASAGSSLYLYSAFSELPIVINISEKRGLCFASLPFGGRFSGGLSACFFNILEQGLYYFFLFSGYIICTAKIFVIIGKNKFVSRQGKEVFPFILHH